MENQPSTPLTTAATETSSSQSALAIIKQKILGHEIKCTLNDNRTVIGTLICVDRLQNMILIHASEKRKIRKSVYDCNNDHHRDLCTCNACSTCNISSNTNGNEEGEDGWIMFTREISQVLVPGNKVIKIEINSDSFK